jgi:small subunit ribosomal protein S5
VLELGGVRDVLAKSLGTTNPINMLKAAVNGLQALRRPEEVARSRGLRISDVLPIRRDDQVPDVAEAEPATIGAAPAGSGEDAPAAAAAPRVEEPVAPDATAGDDPTAPAADVTPAPAEESDGEA